MSKYSSYPNHQLVTENWRAYVNPPAPLTEAFNAKDLFRDAIQIMASTGAVAGTGGAGGDVITDSFFAIETAKDVLVEVEGLISELATLRSIASETAALNYGDSPQRFYAQVKGILKKTIAAGTTGDEVKEFIKDVQEATATIIERIIRAISKWVSALLPDDFGLGGPAFESTMNTAIFAAAENSYNLASSGIEKLGETGKLLTDADALGAFLTKMVDSLISLYRDHQDRMENPKTFWDKLTAFSEKNAAYHPYVALFKWAADTPDMWEKIISILEEAKKTWIPTAVAVMRRLISLLFTMVAVFQAIMRPDERKDLLNIKVGDLDLADPTGIEDMDLDLSQVAESLNKHSSFPEHQLMTENWRKYLRTT